MSGPKILDSRLLKGSTVLGSGTNDSLNLPRGSWQIDGVAVTASAAALNGADGPKVAYAGGAIAKGRLVYVSGITSNVPAVTPAGASSPAHAAQYMVTSAIGAGGIGRIDNVGRVSGLSTADLGAVDGNVYAASAGTGLMASSVSGPLLITQRVAQVVTRDSGTGGVLELLIGTPQKWGRGAIQNSAINAGLLNDDAVIQRHITNSSISAAHVQMSGLSGLQIKAGGIVNSRMGNSAVSAGNLRSSVVTQAKLGNSAISAAHVQMSSLSGLQIKALGIVQSRIGASSISAAKVQMSSLSGLQIAPLGIVNSRLGISAVSAAKIGASAVTQAKIGPLAVSALKMAIAAPNVLVGTGPGGAIEAMATPQITKHTVSALGSGLDAAAARVVVPFPVSLPDTAS